MKKGIGIVIGLCCMVHSIFGLTQYQLSDFMDSKGSRLNMGYTTIDSNSYFKAGLSPDFELGYFTVGLNLNVYLPLGDHGAPKGVDWLSLRYLGMDYEDKHGFKLGRLQGLTFGQGLLVDNFDTGGGGSNEFSMKKAGLLGYITVYDTKITGLKTAENVEALRVQRQVADVASVPVIVGGTYIRDTDGIDDTSSGAQVTRAEQDGVAVDVVYPIGGVLFTPYVEYAELLDQGKGGSVGFKGSLIELINYRAEYRIMGAGFVPGYFNSTYQQTSFNLAEDALQEKVAGFLVGAGASLMDGYAKVGMQYENYEDTNVVSGALGWRQIGPVTGVVNVVKPFNTSDDRMVAIANLYYETGKFYDALIRIKRVYETKNTYSESVSVGVSMRPDKFLPGLPF